MDLTEEQEEQLDSMFWELIDRGASARDAQATIMGFVKVLADARAEETGEDD